MDKTFDKSSKTLKSISTGKMDKELNLRTNL